MLFFDLTFTPDRVYLPFPEKHLFFFYIFSLSYLFFL